jgi:dipeptidyl aminopeptidase/acylaminoacyl peptidase
MRPLRSAVLRVALVTAAVVTLTTLTTTAAAQAPLRPMSFDDVLAMSNVSDAQISPDGKWIAYVVTKADLTQNAADADLWLVPAACPGAAGAAGATDAAASTARVPGCEPIRLTTSPKRDAAPHWSPDGRWIAFISARDDKPQIYRISPTGGEAERISDSKAGVSDFEWSPDGTRIAYLAQRDPTPDDERRQKEKDDALVVDQDFRFTHLWVLDVAARTAKTIVAGDLQVSDPQWSPDGRSIVFTATPTPKADDGRRSDVYVVATDGGAPRKLVDNPGADGSPRWSPDGRRIALVTRQARDPVEVGLSRLAVVDATGGEPTVVAQRFDRQPGAPVWSADGSRLFFVAADRTTTQLYAVPASGGTPAALTNVAGVISGASFSRDGSLVAFTQSDVQHPADVYVGRVGAPVRAERRTDHNPQLATIALGKSEVVRWKGRDGMDVEGIVVYPVDYQQGRRYPTVAFIHGGPAGAWMQSFPGSWGNFAHVWAGRGWVSFFPNPRGSTNYGERFLRANIRDWGGGDFQDIQTGLDALVARGVSDTARLAQSGWSYGGYMTAWTLTQTNRFKAVMVGAGLTDMFSMYSTNDIPSTIDGYFRAEPWNDTTEYRKRSAMTFIKRARTPTLIQHGQSDQRVPIGQAQELYLGLKRNGVPVELVFYPREGHGLGEPRHQLDKMRREYAWFARYVLGESAAALQAGEQKPTP